MTCATSSPIRAWSTRPFYRPIKYFDRVLGINSGILPVMSLPAPLPDEPVALQALVLELRCKIDDQGQTLKQREAEIAPLARAGEAAARKALRTEQREALRRLSCGCSMRLRPRRLLPLPWSRPLRSRPMRAESAVAVRCLRGSPGSKCCTIFPRPRSSVPAAAGRSSAEAEETSEQLDIIPARIQVLRHIRPKYACPVCSEGVKTAPLPAQPISKSLASPGLLAYVAVAQFDKTGYADALPLCRQESILGRIGVELPRATLAHWMVKTGELIAPLVEQMRADLLDGDIVQMDETTVQVLKEPGRSPTTQSYVWVRAAAAPPSVRSCCSPTTPLAARRSPSGCSAASKGIFRSTAMMATPRPRSAPASCT